MTLATAFYMHTGRAKMPLTGADKVMPQQLNCKIAKLKEFKWTIKLYLCSALQAPTTIEIESATFKNKFYMSMLKSTLN